MAILLQEDLLLQVRDGRCQQAGTHPEHLHMFQLRSNIQIFIGGGGAARKLCREVRRVNDTQETVWGGLQPRRQLRKAHDAHAFPTMLHQLF